ncbi:MAG: hypothetical protein COT73_07695 [Bdellovibrio sp. CG10_big_fil_rev_8_21_14_0_10_47_8]|nr:MAG: hypothetical protein COT73_07695 [Bdellovibrio sp. CG10_big_fil_rev_8_21_14_0_10_47_8]
MKLIITSTVLVLLYLVYGFYLSQNDLTVIPADLKRELSSDYYDYRGVTNVRTDLSNGSSSPLEVISDAKQSGLDFIFLTDLNPFEVSESLDGYHGNLLVFVAGEYSFLDSRILYANLDPTKKPSDSSEANLFFTDLLSKKYRESPDTLVTLASPFKNGNPVWSGTYPTGLDGVEIVNPKSIAAKAWVRSRISVLWSFIIYPFNLRYSFLRLFKEPSEETSLWDQLSRERPTSAFGGADASARAVPWANALLKFPSYQKSMEITNNHVLLNSELTGNQKKDRQKIFNALKRGNFYVSLDILGDPRGFFAVMEAKDRKTIMGEHLNFSKDLHLRAKLPIVPKDFYEIVVFKNGEREFASNSPELDYPVAGPGIYRVIVRVSPYLPIPDGIKWITWIYTNNFYVE